jgi:hypothetical protein
MRTPAARVPAFPIVVVLAACLFLVPPSAPGQSRGGGHSGVSLDTAVERARRGGARILSADTVSQDGRSVHVIKILTKDGRVRRLTVDAGAGEGAARRGGPPRRR